MSIYLHISSGSGPRECELAVVRIASAFVKEARRAELEAEILWEGEATDVASSVILRLSGSGVDGFADARLGTVQWTSPSPFRPKHRRKNWFVSVSKAPKIAEVPTLDEKDIRFQSMRASGPGGQHVNKTDSAVRATHAPTGISVTAQAERSQHANKKLALMKLALLFADRADHEAAGAKTEMWKQNKELERGNACRVYVGKDFKLK